MLPQREDDKDLSPGRRAADRSHPGFRLRMVVVGQKDQGIKEHGFNFVDREAVPGALYPISVIPIEAGSIQYLSHCLFLYVQKSIQ